MRDLAFVTPRLLVQCGYVPGDAEEALEIYGDPAAVEFIGAQVLPDVAAMRARIEFLMTKYARYEGRVLGAFPLRARDTGKLVGTGLLKYLPVLGAQGELIDSEDLEVGWHLVPSEWGKGYATEVGRGLLEFGFAQHDVSVLHAVVEPPNTRSLAVAHRLGMQHTGLTSRYYGRTLEHFEARRTF